MRYIQKSKLCEYLKKRKHKKVKIPLTVLPLHELKFNWVSDYSNIPLNGTCFYNNELCEFKIIDDIDQTNPMYLIYSLNSNEKSGWIEKQKKAEAIDKIHYWKLKFDEINLKKCVMGWGITFKNELVIKPFKFYKKIKVKFEDYLNRGVIDKLYSEKEELDDMILYYERQIIALMAATPHEVKYENGEPWEWIDYITYKYNEIMDEFKNTVIRLSIVDRCLENKNELEMDY